MADNYLEKRYDETLGSAKPKVKRIGKTLDDLLRKNRSTRGYYKPYIVKESELRRIIEVCTRVPSACNQQVLRFLPVTKGSGANKILALIKMGAALPDLHLPFPGTEPEAFIICCSTAKETPLVDMDLGIAAQSMLLKATEMGLNGLIIGAFNRDRLRETFTLPYPPLLVIAIGKGAEQIELTPIGADESHAYYRRNGIHYVPKVHAEDLIIKTNA